ncbi:MAG: HAD family hydrolase [Xanthobacteraceae bacterium]
MVALKGVVFDVDGTLLSSAHQVSPRMREVCRYLVEHRIWLTIASARPPKSVLQIADVIGATGPFCALNGAIIAASDGCLLSRSSLSRAVVAHLVRRFTGDSRINLNLYSGTEWFVPNLDRRIQEEASIVGFQPIILPDLSKVGEVEKILLMTDASLASFLVDDLVRTTGEMTVARSNPGYVEITPTGIAKMLGVETAAHSAGLSLAELVACGDGENDITLLAQAGHGISMAHAPAGLKAVASQIVGSNDDDTLPAALMALFQ